MTKEKRVPVNTMTRNLCDFASPTGNIYETVVILSKRSNQIAMADKKELNEYLDAVKTDRDTMEEVVENREQIDISKRFERRPKPALRAIAEFEDSQIYYEKVQEGGEGSI